MKLNNYFQNKVALVTGSTSGIGLEIAKKLLEQGCYVIINYHKNNIRAHHIIKNLSSFNNNSLLIKADTSQEHQVKDMFQKIKEKYRKLDFLINNAGISKNSEIKDTELTDLHRIIDVNIVGKFLCTKHAIPLLKLSKQPGIVNIASRLGTKPNSKTSAYSLSQSAIINFTKSSALELIKYNIRVNCVSPALTMTSLTLQTWSKEKIKNYTKTHPMQRLCETEDIANAVLFLLSDKSKYITGENLNVNGGVLLL